MISCDMCIIGAGIIGSSLAYELSMNNFNDVVLLDQVSVDLLIAYSFCLS